MDRLYDLIVKSKQNDKNALLSLLYKFEPSFKHSLHQTPFYNQADMQQELEVKIIEAIIKYDLNSCPGFWKFIKMDVNHKIN